MVSTPIPSGQSQESVRTPSGSCGRICQRTRFGAIAGTWQRDIPGASGMSSMWTWEGHMDLTSVQVVAANIKHTVGAWAMGLAFATTGRIIFWRLTWNIRSHIIWYPIPFEWNTCRISPNDPTIWGLQLDAHSSAWIWCTTIPSDWIGMRIYSNMVSPSDTNCSCTGKIGTTNIRTGIKLLQWLHQDMNIG